MKIVDVKMAVMDEEVIRQHPRQQIFFNLFAENWHRRQAQRPAAEKQ